MKSLLTTLCFAFACVLFSYGQEQVVLVNKTDCPLRFHMAETSITSPCTFVQSYFVVVPAQTAMPLTVLNQGAEFTRTGIGFVNNNCVGMSLSAPANNCVSCQSPWFLSSYSFTPYCKNKCYGTNFNLQWFDCNMSGNGIAQVVVWQ
ncbi:MAG: hypothetical protein ACFB10_05280 [Salibacteraceae bacterium]